MRIQYFQYPLFFPIYLKDEVVGRDAYSMIVYIKFTVLYYYNYCYYYFVIILLHIFAVLNFEIKAVKQKYHEILGIFLVNKKLKLKVLMPQMWLKQSSKNVNPIS